MWFLFNVNRLSQGKEHVLKLSIYVVAARRPFPPLEGTTTQQHESPSPQNYQSQQSIGTSLCYDFNLIGTPVSLPSDFHDDVSCY